MEATARSHETPVVHVVEADARVRESVTLLLIRRGWAVQAFDSERSFLEGVGPDPFGCLLIGQGPREPLCRDVQDELRARRVDLPAVFLDTYGSPPGAAAARATDALAEQPWYRDALERRVHEAVAWHARHRTLQRDASDQASRHETLTRRETEVLSLLEKGLSSKRVGRELDISHRTVDVHRANVMRKLGVRSLAQLRRRRSAERASGRTNGHLSGDGYLRDVS